MSFRKAIAKRNPGSEGNGQFTANYHRPIGYGGLTARRVSSLTCARGSHLQFSERCIGSLAELQANVTICSATSGKYGTEALSRSADIFCK